MDLNSQPSGFRVDTLRHGRHLPNVSDTKLEGGKKKKKDDCSTRKAMSLRADE